MIRTMLSGLHTHRQLFSPQHSSFVNSPGAREGGAGGIVRRVRWPLSTRHQHQRAVFGLSKAPGHRFRQGRGYAAHAHPHSAAHLSASVRRAVATPCQATPCRLGTMPNARLPPRKTPPPGIPRAPGAGASPPSRSRPLPDAARRGARARTCPHSDPCTHSMLAIARPPPAIPAGDGVPHVVESSRSARRYVERRRAPNVVESAARRDALHAPMLLAAPITARSLLPTGPSAAAAYSSVRSSSAPASAHDLHSSVRSSSLQPALTTAHLRCVPPHRPRERPQKPAAGTAGVVAGTVGRAAARSRVWRAGSFGLVRRRVACLVTTNGAPFITGRAL